MIALHEVGTNWPKWGVVHELAHTWDAANGMRLSQGLEDFTGGSTTWWGEYKHGGLPPKGADQYFNRKEDFAESVTAFVYPGKAQSEANKKDVEFHYENYYRNQRALYVARQLNMSSQEFRGWQRTW